MTQSKASLKNSRVAPRKARIIADLVRGKNVERALAELKFLNKRHAEKIAKLISSAASNADANDSKSRKNLVVESIEVNSGKTMKRYRPASRGRAAPMRKKLSHIHVTLSGKDSNE